MLALFAFFPDVLDGRPLRSNRPEAQLQGQCGGDEFFEFALRMASGERTGSKKLGLGDNGFVLWTVGPVL